MNVLYLYLCTYVRPLPILMYLRTSFIHTYVLTYVLYLYLCTYVCPLPILMYLRTSFTYTYVLTYLGMHMLHNLLVGQMTPYYIFMYNS